MTTSRRLSLAAWVNGLLLACAVGCGGSTEQGGPCTGGESLCGCPEPTTLVLDTRVTDGAGSNAAGINVSCKGESAPIAVTDQGGRIHVELATKESPGCGFERCNNLVFKDPAGKLPTVEKTAFQVMQGGNIVLN